MASIDGTKVSRPRQVARALFTRAHPLPDKASVGAFSIYVVAVICALGLLAGYG